MTRIVSICGLQMPTHALTVTYRFSVIETRIINDYRQSGLVTYIRAPCLGTRSDRVDTATVHHHNWLCTVEICLALYEWFVASKTSDTRSRNRLQKWALNICQNSTPDSGVSFFVPIHDFWRRWLPSRPELWRRV